MRVEMSGITVRFGAVLAVDELSLKISPGEVHALVGENGAGKSTAMNALFGLARLDSGAIRVNGREVHWRNPQDAIQAGIGMVHQHFMLQHSMSVLENVVLCSEPVDGLGLVRFGQARSRVTRIAEDYGIAVAPEARVGDLSVGERQMVEIFKVLYGEAELLILDEPTAVLTPQEIEGLFKVLQRLRDSGKSIVLITHKIDEVMEIADHVSVMRGGRLIASTPRSETSKAEVGRAIVGGELPVQVARSGDDPGEVVLAVEELSARVKGKAIGPVSLTVRRGEIIGIAGVSGNGQAELVQAVVGLVKATSGQITILGQPAQDLGVGARRNIGLSYIPEDRQRVGLALEASVMDNAVIGQEGTAAFRRGPLLNRIAIRRFASELIERYRIRVSGPGARAASMSGGNKQKLVVARELSREAPLVVAENPTWGVDIGAIDFIHKELIRMRNAGHAVLLVSTELDEVLALSDRIHVMFEGRIAGSFQAGEADRQAIGRLMTSRDAIQAKVA